MQEKQCLLEKNKPHTKSLVLQTFLTTSLTIGSCLKSCEMVKPRMSVVNISAVISSGRSSSKQISEPSQTGKENKCLHND